MTTQLMRPRTVLIIECRTCKQPWTYGEIDTDGNGPCCRAARLMDTTDLMMVEMGRVKAKIETLTEDKRVLSLANKSLARRLEKLERVFQAAQEWRQASMPLSSVSGKQEAEGRLLAAIEAVEESK